MAGVCVGSGGGGELCVLHCTGILQTVEYTANYFIVLSVKSNLQMLSCTWEGMCSAYADAEAFLY